MKRFLLILAAASLWSCSNDEQVQSTQTNTTQNSLSVLDGKLLSFKDDESFIKEYNGLSELNTNQLKSWDSGKKFTALLSVSDDLSAIECDIVPASRLVYSDALKALLSSESKVKIENKILWLNGRFFYLLSGNQIDKSSEELISIKNNLEVYGKLLSLSNSNKSVTARDVLPNENRIKTFVTDEMNVSGSRLRHVLDLFNETIVLNEKIQTSKMYIRLILQYRSCSTFKCTWKEAYNVRNLSSELYTSTAVWPLTAPVNFMGISGTQTYLISNWVPSVPFDLYANFTVSGPVICTVSGQSTSVNISWY
jgi:hypothetical protein